MWEERWDEILKEYDENKKQKEFCKAYLRTMDPERAAVAAQTREDGVSLLARKPLQQRLEKMRETMTAQIQREDVLRRMTQLAFGQANDAVRLALSPGTVELEKLDLSAVAELKVTDKGGVEIKLVDRIRALESLFHMLESSGEGNASELYQVLAEAAGEEGSWEHD